MSIMRATSICFLMFLLLLAEVIPARATVLTVPGSGLENMSGQAYTSWMDSLELGPADPVALTITEPLFGATLPANAAAPIISWQTDASTVLVRLVASSLEVRAICTHTHWIPDQETWAALRAAARGNTVHISIAPLGGDNGRTILEGSSTSVAIDAEELTAPIAYLQLSIPFRMAKRHPQLATWRKANLDDPGDPRTVMTDLPVCANCHAYSSDGTAMLLDMDIDGDKGGFVLVKTRAEVRMERTDCRSWNTLPATAPSPYSFGLFASLSPDGRFAVATVGETSLFVMLDHDDYSQLFFPVTGQISIFDRKMNAFSLLPGTTDPSFVHTGPRFSPDGETIAFSRAPVRQDYVQAVLDKTVQNESSNSTIQELNARYACQFDLCTLPFPNTQGVAPRLLTGASANGKSNYFPRYSPDGRWIVFTQAPTGLVLQPDSRLCIVAAEGGEVRELACNTERMNSWHSWSPDGKWLIFSAKGSRDETEIFLARMHGDGTSSPAIRLHRLSTPRFACVVPEFLPGTAATLRAVGLAFAQETNIDTRNNVR